MWVVLVWNVKIKLNLRGIVYCQSLLKHLAKNREQFLWFSLLQRFTLTNSPIFRDVTDALRVGQAIQNTLLSITRRIIWTLS